MVSLSLTMTKNKTTHHSLLTTHHSLPLILPNAQQHQGAGIIGFDAILVGEAAEVGVFGAGVKYDAFGLGVDDIIVQGRLVLRA